MSSTPRKSDPLGEIIAPYYRAWFRYHPEAAVDAGVPGYAHLLTPYTQEDMGALVCLNDELVVGLDELDRDKLDQDAQVDYQILRAAALLENEYYMDVAPRIPDPARVLPVNAIYQLTIRPVADFEQALTARLRAIPQHLQNARDHLLSCVERIPALWLGSTVTAAQQGAGFVSGLRSHPTIVGRLDVSTEFNELLTNAARALSEFAVFLERELTSRATGDFACGATHFEQLLRNRHFLDITADQLYAFGQKLFDQTQKELTDACRLLTGNGDIASALREIQKNHPPAERLLDVYREQMQAARRFVMERELITVPEQEQLEVVETPAFLRHQIPFAAYSEPTPSDPEQRGRYYVTLPTDSEQLAEHDSAGLMHTCVHEAWPGHHLQFVLANHHANARTLPRTLNPSATLYEGWALYCEQLMHEQGFLNRPEQLFILLRDRLWRALRVLIDVGIHTRDLSVDAAADLMVRHLGFPRSQALADITWYSRAPTAPSSYATGWALIQTLRKQMMRATDTTFQLRDFHDRLLANGSIAVSLAIERAFGRQQWAEVQREVLGVA